MKYAVLTEPVFQTPDGNAVYLPLEYCNTLTSNWFYRKDQHVLHPSAATIAGWYRQARAAGANLLLNVGPDCRGKIPEYHLEYLEGAAKEMGIGEK